MPTLEHQRREKSSLHKCTWDWNTETQIFVDICTGTTSSAGILSLDFRGVVEMVHKHVEHCKAWIIRNLRDSLPKSITSFVFLHSLWMKNRSDLVDFQAIHFLPTSSPPQFDQIYWSDTWTFPHCDSHGWNMQIQGAAAEKEKLNITLKKKNPRHPRKQSNIYAKWV